MGRKQIIVLACMLFLLTACESKKEEEFNEQESTFLDAQQLVEDGMKEYGLNVMVSDMHYDNIGKSKNTSRFFVIYATEHKPTYNGRAFLHVDKESEPRQFSGIDHLGLEYTEGLISIGDVLMRHIYKDAYQFTVSIVEDLMKEIPELSWEKSDKITFNQVEWEEGKISDLIKVYGEDKFEELTEEKAAQWFEHFQVDSEGEKSELQLKLIYSGKMSSGVFEELLQKLANIEGIWTGPLFVRIKAEQFDESEKPVYNESFNEQGSSVFRETINKEK